MSGIVEDAVAQRVQGDAPSRVKAIAAAVVIGLGAALLAYRLLRSASESDSESESEPESESE